MKNNLIRLIKYAILPALFLFLGKIFGILSSAQIFNVPAELRFYNNKLFFFDIFIPAGYSLQINSYGNLIMYIIIALGITVILFQALFFHDSHVSVHTVNKLADWNLLNLIKSSIYLYHSGSIWLLFLWLSWLIILFDSINGSTYVWVMITTFVFNIAYTAIFLRDLFSEIEIAGFLKKENGKNN